MYIVIFDVFLRIKHKKSPVRRTGLFFTKTNSNNSNLSNTQGFAWLLFQLGLMLRHLYKYHQEMFAVLV